MSVLDQKVFQQQLMLQRQLLLQSQQYQQQQTSQQNQQAKFQQQQQPNQTQGKLFRKTAHESHVLNMYTTVFNSIESIDEWHVECKWQEW